MRPLSEFEAEELLAGYVLNALPPDEVIAVEAHLRGCDEHRRAAADLSATASSLALVVDDQEPPVTLKQRVADAIRLDSRAARTTIPDAGAAILRPMRPDAWRRVLRPPAQLVAAAAVAIALAIGILVGMRIAAPAQQTWTFKGNQFAPQGQATLVYDRGQHSGVLAVTGLPSLRPGQVYEVWLIRGGTPVDAGISEQANGSAVVRISYDPTQYQTLAITVEPGEQSKPTTTPILAGQLR